jgi:ubiquinone/menaquinone biosynthesis C-methylase UbiE
MLIDYFLNNQERNMIHKPTSYFEVYERYFSKFVGKKPKVLEIGIGQGGSLKMWSEYFGKGSQIIGFDINEKCLKFEEDGIKIYIGDQSDITSLSLMTGKEIEFDIIIDDGGHSMNQQITSYKYLIQFVKIGGVYLCEDLHTSYMPEYKDQEETFIDMAKRIVDYVNQPGYIKAIHFHQSIVVFEKDKNEALNILMIGKKHFEL